MEYIPLENKISLINKYIQINILRNKGKAEHVDLLENDIFKSIIEELKAQNEIPETPVVSLTSTIANLSAYQDKQADLQFQINALMNTLENVREEDSEQINLENIIKNLKEMDQS
jgi:hypothetical protein